MSNPEANTNRNMTTDGADRVEEDSYDRHIIPAETAARREREGDLFKTHPTEEREASASTNDQTDSQSIRTTDGYTVDKEGLINNYAVEPEMYYETPGDARQQAEEDKAARVSELKEVNQNSQGDLNEGGDQRGRGTGVV